MRRYARSTFAAAGKKGGTMKLGLFLSALIAPALFACPASAQNLHQKYGASWNCKFITLGAPLYPPCQACESRGMEFYKDGPSSGHCVPRAGSAARNVPRGNPSFGGPTFTPRSEPDDTQDADASMTEPEGDEPDKDGMLTCAQAWRRYARESPERQRIIREECPRSDIATAPPPAPRPSEPEPLRPAPPAELDMAKMYEIKLCNTTTLGAIYAAYAVYDDPEDKDLTVHAWYKVLQGQCVTSIRRFFGQYGFHTIGIYVYSEDGKTEWTGNAAAQWGFCVPNTATTRLGGETCSKDAPYHQFNKVVISRSEEHVTTFTYTIR
jgi:hypothetical protein